MKKVVDYVAKNPRHTTPTIRSKTTRKFTNRNSISRLKKYIDNNGTKTQQLIRIDQTVYEKYKQAREVFMPVHTVDLKR